MENLPLDQVSQKVLSEWAMMMVDPAPGATLKVFENELMYLGTVEFNGPVHGTLFIVAPDCFLGQLTKNLLCLEPEDSVSQQDKFDALREMVNVLTGNFLTTAFGDEVVFDVIEPMVHKVDMINIASVMEANAKCSHYYLADGNPVALSYQLEH